MDMASIPRHHAHTRARARTHDRAYPESHVHDVHDVHKKPFHLTATRLFRVDI